MSASLLAESELLAGLPSLVHPFAGDPLAITDELCPVCDHSIHGSHREVYPWDRPPMLLCFLLLEGRRCFTECGACRRSST